LFTIIKTKQNGGKKKRVMKKLRWEQREEVKSKGAIKNMVQKNG
jgi:hypothetical protein